MFPEKVQKDAFLTNLCINQCFKMLLAMEYLEFLTNLKNAVKKRVPELEWQRGKKTMEQ